MASSLGADWRRVVAWYAANAHPDKLRLPPGVTEPAIAAAEDRLEFQLPDELRDFYRMHDGLGGSWLVQYGEFHSLPDMIAKWERLCRWTRDDGLAVGSPPAPREVKGPIQRVWWSPRWLPITDRGGDHVMVDLDPPPDGRVGQVFQFDHEVGPTAVLARGFAAWIRAIADDLEAGKLVWQEQHGGVAPPGFWG